MFLTTSSRRLGEQMSAAKLSPNPLKRNDEKTSRNQNARSAEVLTNNDQAPNCKTPGWG